METRLQGWLPGQLHGLGTLAAKEVDAENGAGQGFASFNRGVGDLHTSIPGFPVLLYAGCNQKARSPRGFGNFVWLFQVDIQIEPFPLRGQFKLPVSMHGIALGSDEDFRYVPVPKSRRLLSQ